MLRYLADVLSNMHASAVESVEFRIIVSLSLLCDGAHMAQTLA